MALYEQLSSASFLEYAFLRWILTPAVSPGFADHVEAQAKVEVDGHHYRVDYEVRGSQRTIAVELDGFEFHSDRDAFSYDRLRQNDLGGTGRDVLRFSYDSIRHDTGRCVAQLQTHLLLDPALAAFVVENPLIETPDMDPDPLFALRPSPLAGEHPNTTMPTEGDASPVSSYFAGVSATLNLRTLRQCQSEAFAALANYYGSGGTKAACVMSVGAGKTALGVLACLAFTGRRAMVVTPGSVIRGTFDKAFDHTWPHNVLYTLPGGPLIPGSPPPKVRTLDRNEGAIKNITREQLLGSDVILTNFHSLGNAEDPDDLLAKLWPDDIDFIVIDEAHIAAADSYQRLFRHFSKARTLLMSACFQRMDGKPIDADVVYRYRLIDSIADGNAKSLRVERFAPEFAETIYEIHWPDGEREEIVGRDAILEVIGNERKLASITAKSTQPIRQIMRAVKASLDYHAELLQPVKPRVLFSALGERHAEQIATIAEEHGIPCSHLHHSMPESRIRSIRNRFESDSGDLQGIVQLRMLGQGYDFPPITVVVPMRPYASFAEFYQFVGRGIRVIIHPALTGRVGPGEQFLDIVFHAELGLEEHIDTIYVENDMDPITAQVLPLGWSPERDGASPELPGTTGLDTAGYPEAFVLFERGAIESRIIHDQERIDKRRQERALEALAQRYAKYAASSSTPMTFDQYCEVLESLHE